MAGLRANFPDDFMLTAMECGLLTIWIDLAVIAGLALIGANLGLKLNTILGKFPSSA